MKQFWKPPARPWRWRSSGSRNTHGRATKTRPPPSAPELSQAFTSREPVGRRNSCPAYKKARGPVPGPGSPGRPSNPLCCRERFLRPRLLPQCSPPQYLPGIAAALTMTAAGRGRVPPAPLLCSPGRRPGRGGPTVAAAALAAPLHSPQPQTPSSDSDCTHRTNHPARPVALNRPRAHRHAFIAEYRPRHPTPPPRPLSTAPRPVTSERTVLSIRRARSLPASSEQKREKLWRGRVAGRPMGARWG